VAGGAAGGVGDAQERDMIKALSIQVQSHLLQGLDIGAVQTACEAIASMPLVARHHFDHGHDTEHYFNFTFGTEDLAALWRELESCLYSDPVLGSSLRAASMAMCEGDHGWDDYLLLYHFDLAVRRDAF
jgi:hypothetical protein